MSMKVILFRRKTMFYNQLRYSHRSTGGSSVPTFEMNKEKKAFQYVLPEVINSAVSGAKLSELPEVRSWIKKLLEYILSGGKLGRELMVSIGYRMFEEPENYSEETQHSARDLGWCVEMLQSHFLLFDDLLDGGVIRRGKPCWHLQPDVRLSAINDALLIHQSLLKVLDVYFGKSPIFTDLLRQFNEAVERGTIGEHLDLWSNARNRKNGPNLCSYCYKQVVLFHQIADIFDSTFSKEWKK